MTSRAFLGFMEQNIHSIQCSVSFVDEEKNVRAIYRFLDFKDV